MRSKARSGLLAGATALLLAGHVSAQPSPALCGSLDTPETGIQGDTAPSGGANCGLSLIAEVPGGGAVQGSRHCAYVRGGGVRVFDMSDPANPTLIRTLSPFDTSETLRAVTTDSRAVLVEGSSVWDISDCENPVLKGEIDWPGLLPWPAGLHHDIRINLDATKVYAGLGAVVADISNLDDPTQWRVKNWTCAVAQQFNHPFHPPGSDLCDLVDWEAHPVLAHGPGVSGDGTKWYVGNQTLVSTVEGGEPPTLRVLDATVEPPQILGTTLGPGHSIDWFATGGREYVLHNNEIVANPSSSCVPHPRPQEDELGHAHDAMITDVTDPANPTRIALVELAINKPENCSAKMASNQATDTTYNAIDDPYDAHFAMVRMGNAGMRVFDIRNPAAPSEVAYFNRGSLQHAGSSHYDASTGTIWIPGSAFRVLEIQPQVLDALGLPHPPAPYPRYPNGRPATP